ncbi:unnamed protein product [Ectocarpus sp. CCAP 1310/34]|nr:unnamed protein product [Ectocarpus sp. CCAP 1310/34]CAB1109941.1 unnamed protein product [Ectocarpus sp. CCAP 1310/34]
MTSSDQVKIHSLNGLQIYKTAGQVERSTHTQSDPHRQPPFVCGVAGILDPCRGATYITLSDRT